MNFLCSQRMPLKQLTIYTYSNTLRNAEIWKGVLVFIMLWEILELKKKWAS